MNHAPQTQSPVWATFAGPIDQALVQKVFQTVGVVSTSGIQAVHLLLQSTGGSVGEGVVLYNYFRSIPLDLHIYNGGQVSSIAVIAFLGARNRYASAHSTFTIHRTYASLAMFTSAMGANAERLRSITQALEVDDDRTRAILTSHLRLSAEKLDYHLTNEVPLNAHDALECGLVTAIQEFAPPSGQILYNL
jgi:ATP-dependent Clp protease protease subunit